MIINAFSQLKSQISQLSVEQQSIALTKTMQQLIPIFGTLGVQIDTWEHESCQLSLPNEKIVQNTIGSIQAAGIYTVAEGVMALAVGANLPVTSVVVAKSVKIDYLKKCFGKIKAQTQLSPEQIARFETEEKGSIELTSTVTDETDTLVCECRAEWVWYEVQKK